MLFTATLAILAQAGQQGGMTALMIQLAPLVLIGLIFYFLLIRPQRQRQKQHEEMVKALRPGDKIVTQGGLIATVTKSDEGTATLRVRLAPSVEVTLLRSHVAAKTTEDIQ